MFTNIIHRKSVIYDKKASRKVYLLENTKGERFICKTFPQNISEINFKEKLYSIFTNSIYSIPAIHNTHGVIIQKVGNLYFILFKYCDLSPIIFTNIENIILNYNSFHSELQKLKYDTRYGQYKKDIISTILRLSCLPKEFSDIIGKFTLCASLQKKLILYLKNYHQDNSWIHGSLWKENIYFYNGNIVFIDFDNCTYGDIYYDYSSIALMIYDNGCSIDSILSILIKNIANFDKDRFHLSLLFVILKVVRNKQPYQQEETKRQLYIGINFYFQLCDYGF